MFFPKHQTGWYYVPIYTLARAEGADPTTAHDVTVDVLDRFGHESVSVETSRAIIAAVRARGLTEGWTQS